MGPYRVPGALGREKDTPAVAPFCRELALLVWQLEGDVARHPGLRSDHSTAGDPGFLVQWEAFVTGCREMDRIGSGGWGGGGFRRNPLL